MKVKTFSSQKARETTIIIQLEKRADRQKRKEEAERDDGQTWEEATEAYLFLRELVVVIGVDLLEDVAGDRRVLQIHQLHVKVEHRVGGDDVACNRDNERLTLTHRTYVSHRKSVDQNSVMPIIELAGMMPGI